MLLFGLPKWKAIMDMPLADRLEKFADPELRDALVADMANAAGFSGALPMLTVGEVKSEANKPYQGRSLAEIAQTEDKQVAEVILDLSNADDLETEFQLKNIINADKAAVAELIDNPLCHFGASDAGAHITQFCGSGDTTHMLEHYVREAKQIPLERAVHRMTEELARDWGLHDRGTLAPGKAADVVIFDLETVAISEQCFVDDFPGEASRYLRKAVGYDVVIVNGEPVLEAGVYTQARPGKVI
jgi:N-acyl-D-aspartate/D-glutamate deacylase